MQVLIQSIIFNSLFSDVEKSDRIADVIANHYTLNSDIPKRETQEDAYSAFSTNSVFIPDFKSDENFVNALKNIVALDSDKYNEMERRYKVYEELVEEVRVLFANIQVRLFAGGVGLDYQKLTQNERQFIHNWMDKLYDKVVIKDQGITPDGQADPNYKAKATLPLSEDISLNSFKMDNYDNEPLSNTTPVDYYLSEKDINLSAYQVGTIFNFYNWLKNHYCVYTVAENIQNNADQYRKGREYLENQFKRLSDTLDERYTEGYKHGRADLNHLIILLKSVRNALKPGGDIEHRSPLDQLGQEVEQTIKLYSKQYSENSEEEQNGGVLKSSSRVDMKSGDFTEFLDSWAKEHYAYYTWEAFTATISPEALNCAYAQSFDDYSQHMNGIINDLFGKYCYMDFNHEFNNGAYDYHANAKAANEHHESLKRAGYEQSESCAFMCENGLRILTYKTHVEHITVSHPDRLPTMRELQWSRDEFLPDAKQMAFVIPANEPAIGSDGNYTLTLFELVYIDK